MKEGSEVRFIGYADAVDEEVLSRGQHVIIDAYDHENGTFAVHLKDDESVTADVFKEEVTAELEGELPPIPSLDPEVPVTEEVGEDVDEEVVAEEPVKAAPAKKAAAKKAAKTSSEPAKKTAAKKVAKAAPAKVEAQAELEIEAEVEQPVRIKKGTKPAPTPKPETTAKKAAKTAKAAEAEEDVLPLTSYTEAVKKMLKNTASALKAAKTLTDSIQTSFWSLGGVLVYIKEQKAYLDIVDEHGDAPYAGRAGFQEYIEHELGMDYRRAMYYSSIYRKLAPLGVDPDTVLRIGYSKASEIIKIADADNVDDLLAQAEGMTRDDLKAYIRSRMVDASDSTEPTEKARMTTFRFKVFDDQGDVIQTALEQAKAAIGATDDTADNAAFSHIMREWLTMQGGSAQIPLDAAFLSLENTYGAVDVSKYCRERFTKAKGK